MKSNIEAGKRHGRMKIRRTHISKERTEEKNTVKMRIRINKRKCAMDNTERRGKT